MDAAGYDLAGALSPDRVLRIAGSPPKETLLDRLVEVLAGDPRVHDRKALATAIRTREEVGSTGIGNGVAVPHARLPSVQGQLVALALIPEGCDYAAVDGAPVRIAAMLAGGESDRKGFLLALAALATRLRDPATRAALLGSDPAAAVRLLAGR